MRDTWQTLRYPYFSNYEHATCCTPIVINCCFTIDFRKWHVSQVVYNSPMIVDLSVCRLLTLSLTNLINRALLTDIICLSYPSSLVRPTAAAGIRLRRLEQTTNDVGDVPLDDRPPAVDLTLVATTVSSQGSKETGKQTSLGRQQTATSRVDVIQKSSATVRRLFARAFTASLRFSPLIDVSKRLLGISSRPVRSFDVLQQWDPCMEDPVVTLHAWQLQRRKCEGRTWSFLIVCWLYFAFSFTCRL